MPKTGRAISKFITGRAGLFFDGSDGPPSAHEPAGQIMRHNYGGRRGGSNYIMGIRSGAIWFGEVGMRGEREVPLRGGTHFGSLKDIL
ncbi:hypothetical protein L3X38_030191 [Prunus dulcis]|uniref:Uncharacterized protein n=1 Tax=Prunus dulcis TaxID=3755 RepID=A0AAD4V9S1_PRUDU|nr:hypothetical protein L3X38_030191 [Prunus dulcis]